jgi:serine/threonine protein kinase
MYRQGLFIRRWRLCIYYKIVLFQQALFNEIQYMQKLDHKNIINLQEVFEGESTFYMILELLEGKSL